MENITRRGFVAAGAAMTAMAATAGVAVAEEAEQAWDYETDVVVCGCGTSGTAAAIEACDAGAEVLVVEKKSWLGGQMRRCGGGVAAAGSQVQKALGIEDDTADAFYDYWMAVSGGIVDPELVRVVCDESAGIIDWIIDDLGGQPLDEWHFCGGEMGIEESVMTDGLNVGTDPQVFRDHGMEPVARCCWFTPNRDDVLFDDPSAFLEPTNPGGTGLWVPFENALAARDIDFLMETSFTDLICAEGTNEVIGVVAQDAEGNEIRIKARRGVVLTNGNFAGNPEMLKNFTGVDFEENAYGGMALDIAGDNDGSSTRAVQALGGALMFPLTHGTGEIVYSFNCGGVKIDTDAHAIDVRGNIIPNLFVASIAAGGVIGEVYPCCGASITRNLVFGRIAGRNAAAMESRA